MLHQAQNSKRANGRYYTHGNPFCLKPFCDWAEAINLSGARVLEPFAGSNNLIKMLRELNLCGDYASFDIKPTAPDVRERDTLASFPKGFEVAITNPPWLARNSATRRGLPFPKCNFDDLYKHCLALCLGNCAYVAAIIPASFLQSGLFRDRLQTYILIHDPLFTDTENPVCLALFGKESLPLFRRKRMQTRIYYDEKYIGELGALEQYIPRCRNEYKLRFNDPEGSLGFFSFDNTKEPSVRFCLASQIKDYEIKESSRFITRISGDFGDVKNLVNVLNKNIRRFREKTHDVFLTPFKGIRDGGQYRRRMDFALARRFINAA